MDDRVIRGGIAGSSCGVIILVADLISHYGLRLTQGAWFGALSYLILGRDPRTTGEFVLGAAGHLLFGGILGAVYARFLVPEPGSGNYVLRGAGFGLAVWFSTLASGSVFHMPRINNISWGTAAFQFSLALFWGIVFGAVMQKWDESVVLKLTGQTAGSTAGQAVGQTAGQCAGQSTGQPAGQPKKTKSVLYQEGEGVGADAVDQGVHAVSGLSREPSGGQQPVGAGLTEFSTELGALEGRMTQVVAKLDEVSDLLKKDREDDGGWEHVEHLGFKVLHREEETEDRD